MANKKIPNKSCSMGRFDSRGKFELTDDNLLSRFYFEITIDYDLTLRELMVATYPYLGSYYHEHIPSNSGLEDKSKGKIRRKFEIIKFYPHGNFEDYHRKLTFIEILDILDDNDYRPATIKEILTINLFLFSKTVKLGFLELCSIYRGDSHEDGGFIFPSLSFGGDCSRSSLQCESRKDLKTYDGILIVKKELRKPIHENKAELSEYKELISLPVTKRKLIAGGTSVDNDLVQELTESSLAKE